MHDIENRCVVLGYKGNDDSSTGSQPDATLVRHQLSAHLARYRKTVITVDPLPQSLDDGVGCVNIIAWMRDDGLRS